MEGLVSNFMASQEARLYKFKAYFKQQQSKMTNKINTVLKAITDRIAGVLPSDTVKNPKLSTSQRGNHFSNKPVANQGGNQTATTKRTQHTLEDEFKDLHLNLSVLEVIAHAPIYNTMLDKYVESLELGKNRSAFVQREISAKMEDSRLFILPCRLGNSKPFDTLANLRSCVNIIPLYLFKKLNIGVLEEIDHIFGLTDRTKSYPVEIVKDVEVRIGKLKLLNDFYVIDMKKDLETPLLIGKGFLATANAVIDCRKAKIAVEKPICLRKANPKCRGYRSRGCIQTGGKITELDANEDVTLVDVDAEVKMDANIQGEDTDKTEPAEIEEVLEVVTAAKLMTEVVTTATPITTAAQVPKASAPREEWVEIRPIFEKHYNSIQAFLKKGEKKIKEEGSKRKGKNLEQDTAKKQRIDEDAEELKRHLQIVANDDDDVYTEATPLASKVLVVDYQIHHENNKPYYKIIRVDGTHKLFLSFITLLKNFDREDLETLWKPVKEIFESIKPKYFSDDFLLNTLKIMFEKSNVEANVWRDHKGRYGLAKKYPLTHFTLEQMLNNVRLEVEEESEMSLELLRRSLGEDDASKHGRNLKQRSIFEERDFDVQAMMDADYELAARLRAEEQR
uniref:Reverse transcriptase domain-containing protein n=1 Tax=Tanacetum cinerariifolium TaxID=118510 RepID=A0A6L2LYY7_TANCI|nr:hypothetical protein [Tanacetum cinerariifolium]